MPENKHEKTVITNRLLIGKKEYEIVSAFNESANETFSDKLERIILNDYRKTK
ncbi:transposon-encoded TnpW family protein [Listeria costaricensis]|uniref:transposon-encoded TnpW family protein n=1 Tax=Listeria costaricensis TaxID=2026604 RepID=UPI000C08A2D7|nr:transposon-encoded TnpW family protein [Listeria costaricensis]